MEIAQQESLDLQSCGGDNNCQDEMCLQDNCPLEYAGCLGGNADTLPCPVASGCLLACNGDPVCELTCGPVDMQTEGEIQDLIDCAGMNLCEDFDCTEQACPAEWSACVSGMESCADTVACVAACNGNELCTGNCVYQTTLQDLFVLQALGDCANQNDCPLGDANCLSMFCGAESMACGL